MLQVKALISLFRPISVPLPPSAASPLPNVPTPHTIPAPLSEQWVQPPSRLPPIEDPYLYSIHQSHALPALDPRYAKVAP